MNEKQKEFLNYIPPFFIDYTPVFQKYVKSLNNPYNSGGIIADLNPHILDKKENVENEYENTIAELENVILELKQNLKLEKDSKVSLYRHRDILQRALDISNTDLRHANDKLRLMSVEI